MQEMKSLPVGEIVRKISREVSNSITWDIWTEVSFGQDEVDFQLFELKDEVKTLISENESE